MSKAIYVCSDNPFFPYYSHGYLDNPPTGEDLEVADTEEKAYTALYLAIAGCPSYWPNPDHVDFEISENQWFALIHSRSSALTPADHNGLESLSQDDFTYHGTACDDLCDNEVFHLFLPKLPVLYAHLTGLCPSGFFRASAAPTGVIVTRGTEKEHEEGDADFVWATTAKPQ